MSAEVALLNNLVFGSVLNTILLTSELLYLDLAHNSSDFFSNIKDEDPLQNPLGTPPKHQFDSTFNPDLDTFDLESIPKDKLKYAEQAETAIQELEYLVAHPGWKLSKKKDDVTVKSLYFPKYARSVMMLQGKLKIEPQKLFEEFWVNGDNAPEWNSDVTQSETLEEIGPSLQIGYKVSGPLAGGSISPRDFLVVVARKKIGDSYYIVYESTKHPLDPKNPEYIRATNGPSGFIYAPAYVDGKLVTDTTWILNLDMHMPSVVPISLVEKMLPMNMLKYSKQLINHVASITQPEE